jgi:hypothetical protein
MRSELKQAGKSCGYQVLMPTCRLANLRTKSRAKGDLTRTMAEDRRLGSRLYLDPATLIISSQEAREQCASTGQAHQSSQGTAPGEALRLPEDWIESENLAARRFDDLQHRSKGGTYESEDGSANAASKHALSTGRTRS